jgi:hypothetical protein
MVHAVADIGEITVQSEGIHSGTCMVFARLYLIVGSFLRAGRAAPAMAADLPGAAHPLCPCVKPLSTLPFTPPAPDPGVPRRPPYLPPGTPRESSARVSARPNASRVPENRIVFEQI